jgi:ketosteroid isomerase-like protein
MRNVRLMVMLGFLMSLPAFADEAADEASVWKMEEVYWIYVKTNDPTGYLSLWDDRFVGWPSFSNTPREKAGIEQSIALLHVNPAEVYDYELTREAVHAFGDVVAAHYLVHAFCRSPETGEIIRDLGNTRITHTWQRRGDSWQIITGMAADVLAKE